MTDKYQFTQDFTNAAKDFLNQLNIFNTVDDAIFKLTQKYPELKEEFDGDTIFSKIFRIESCKILRDMKH